MLPNQRPYEEKRDFIRVSLDCAVHLQHAASGQRFIASGRNLSAGGVLFLTEEPLACGDLLEMHIEADQALFSMLTATVEVLRIEAQAQTATQWVSGVIRTIHEMDT